MHSMMQCRSPLSSQISSHLETFWAGCSAEEFKDAASLKEHLCELFGFAVYLQQLLHDGNVLGDGTELDAPMDLQLVLLTISDGSIFRLARADFADAARRNCDQMVRCLLEAGVDKDIRTDGLTALMLASDPGHVEVVRVRKSAQIIAA